MVRTIEALLGVTPASLYSAVSAPMTEIFDLNQPDWNFKVVVPDLLRTSQLPIPRATADNPLPRTKRVLAFARDQHSAAYWQKKIVWTMTRKTSWTRNDSIANSGRACSVISRTLPSVRASTCVRTGAPFSHLTELNEFSRPDLTSTTFQITLRRV
jgi:hypothetical protein